MALFASKPTTIEAVQWRGDNFDELAAFAPASLLALDDEERGELVMRAGKDGVQGWVDVPVGHWIVRQPGDMSDHWPVDPTYFESKYEPSLSVEEWRDRLGVDRTE